MLRDEHTVVEEATGKSNIAPTLARVFLSALLEKGLSPGILVRRRPLRESKI